MGSPDRELEPLEWVSHPARERPWATVLLVFVILLAGVAASAYGGNPWWGIVGVVLITLTMWSYFMPSHFVIDDWGVRKSSPFGEEKMSWERIRSYVPDRYGVLLSPFAQPTRLAKFRGLSVQFAGNREEVLERIRSRVEGDTAPADR
jgi:hypothetical protein